MEILIGLLLLGAYCYALGNMALVSFIIHEAEETPKFPLLWQEILATALFGVPLVIIGITIAKIIMAHLRFGRGLEKKIAGRS